MSHKSAVVAARVARFGGGRLDPRYLGYFDSFNHQRFHEAHDVLEDLWLLDRRGPNGDFFKGLIQVAGAFVLLQKGRLRAADAVFQLAGSKLRQYPQHHESADLKAVEALITSWRQALKQTAYTANPLTSTAPPFIASPIMKNAKKKSADIKPVEIGEYIADFPEGTPTTHTRRTPSLCTPLSPL